MTATQPHLILIVEPRPDLAKPYDLLPKDSHTLHVTSTPRATQYLSDKHPDLVILSSSYSPPQVLKILEAIKLSSQAKMKLIPLVMSVDLENKNNFIPGTKWANKFGIIHSLSSKKEIEVTLKRVLKQSPTYGFES